MAAAPVLSRREKDVLFLSADGLTDKEIALRLNIGCKTVRTYWDRIRAKLGATSRTQALASALRSVFQDLGEREERLNSLSEAGATSYAYADRRPPQKAGRLRTRTAVVPPSAEVRQTPLPRDDRPTGANVLGEASGRSREVRKLALAQLDRSTLEAIVDLADQAVWILDPEFKTRYANLAMAHLLCTSIESLEAKTPLDFIGDDDHASALALIARGGGSDVPFRFLRCDGSFVPVSKTLIPIKSAEGVSGYLIIASERHGK